MHLGGLDIGTTGCKLSLYTEKGEFVYNAYREYDASRKSGAHELDVETLFAAVCAVIEETVITYYEAAGFWTEVLVAEVQSMSDDKLMEVYLAL